MGKLSLALALAAAAGAQLAQAPTAAAPRFVALVESARDRVRHLRDTDLIAYQKQARRPLYVLDVREDSEWARGRIAGALHLSRGLLEREIEKTVPELDAVIVVYCETGMRSILAAESLQKMGYSNVFSLKGGYRGWVAAGRPTSGGIP